MARGPMARGLRRVGIASLIAGCITASLGISFLLYLVIAAQDNVDDICDVTEVGQGLLPFGDEGGCDPRWLVWGIAVVFYGGMGALPVGAIGLVLVLAAASADRWGSKDVK